eukprot:6207207-Amphidinium_carterae.1
MLLGQAASIARAVLPFQQAHAQISKYTRPYGLSVFAAALIATELRKWSPSAANGGNRMYIVNDYAVSFVKLVHIRDNYQLEL